MVIAGLSLKKIKIASGEKILGLVYGAHTLKWNTLVKLKAQKICFANGE
jgi:hypothetical protein